MAKNELFVGVSQRFHFKKAKPGSDFKDSIYFAREDLIFEYNFETETHKILYEFSTDVRPSQQPTYFEMNTDQKIFMVASDWDCVYCNMNANSAEQFVLVDVDDMLNIKVIKHIYYNPEDKNFYILANKLNEKLGFYVIRVNEDDKKWPAQDEFDFVIRWTNKLDINDCGVFVMNELGRGIELIISFKQIYINTFNIMVIKIDE